MTIVALERCGSYDADALDAALDRALASLGGWRRFVHPGARVLLKPNLVAAHSPETATTTHPAFVEGVLRRVLDLGGVPVIGDSPSFGRAEHVAEKAGIASVAARLNVPIVDFRRRVAFASVDGRRFRVARDVLDADVLINLPKLKVHRQMVLTAGIKNLYGCVPGKKKAIYHLSHGDDRAMFARLILEYVRLIAPALTLVDGIVAMERTGPRFGDPRALGLVVGGEDPVAVDRVCSELLGVPDDANPFMPAARDLGIGETDLSRIDTRGLTIAEARIHEFMFPKLIPVTFSPYRIARSAVRDFMARRSASNPS